MKNTRKRIKSILRVSSTSPDKWARCRIAIMDSKIVSNAQTLDSFSNSEAQII